MMVVLLGVNVVWYPLGVLKSKITTLRVTAVPFRVLSRKIWQKVIVSQP